MKNKKLNNAGFTLIELLAVITIMGILMMVAIPAVTRTIENSRRDSFATIAQNYINSVRNSVLADELRCANTAGTGKYDVAIATATSTNVSAVDSSKTYFLRVDTGTGSTNVYAQQSADLMESGGNSSWGGAPVNGYIKWTRNSHNQWQYSIVLVDSGKHGISTWASDQGVKRTNVVVNNAAIASAITGPLANAFECAYTG